MADNKYKSAIEEVKAGIKVIVSEMETADKIITKLANKASKLGSAFKINTPDGLTDALKEQTYLLKLLSAQLDKQTANTNKLTNAKKQLVTLTGQEKINNRELARNADLYTQSTSKLVGAYGNLIAKQKIAKKVLMDLISAEKQNVNQIRRAQKEYDKYTDRVNKAKQATSNFANNSLGKAVAGFRNLLGAFGVVGGAYLIADFTKKIFNLAKTLDSLRFTMRTVIKDSDEMTRSQAFLADIAERYGQNIIILTNRFVKFRVAAEQSNVSFADTIKIFESFTAVSGVLGLKTDELQGIFLALEQMLSKGKVTTEELRRQLGERLPGAFGITAEVLGVTIEQLDSMLKKGEVLSAETLPKLADGVIAAMGLEQVERIETLAAETERFSNSWVNLVGVVTKSEGPLQKMFIALAKLGTTTLDAWSWIFSSEETIFAKEFDANRLDGYKSGLKEVEQEVQRTGNTEIKVAQQRAEIAQTESDRLKGLIENLTHLNADLLTQGNLVGENKKAYERNNETIRVYNQLLGNSVGALEAYNEILGKTNDTMDEADDKGRTYQDVLDDIKAAKEDLLDSTKEEASGILATISALEKEAEAWERSKKARRDVIEAKKGSIEAQKGSIEYIENQIKAMEDEQQKLAVNSNAYHGYTMAIDSLKEKLLELQSVFEIMGQGNEKVSIVIDVEEIGSMDVFKNMREAILSENDKPSDIFGFDEMLEKTKSAADDAAEYLKKKNIAQYWADKAEFDKIDTLVKTVSDTFAEYYDLDMQKFEFLYDKKENTVEQWADLSKEIISSVLDASLQRYDVELQEAQRANELIQNNELATEKEKRISKEKFEEEERRIKTERAKKERENTLIGIAVDTAAAVAKALAQTGVLAPAVIPTILAIGLTQAALVASQPLPKFAEGTKAPLAKDTLAFVGDGGRSEAITENGKLVGVTPDKPTLMNLKKGQEVQKDANAWINNAVYRMNMESNGEMLSSVMMDNIMHDELRKMRSETKRTWEEVKRLANRPISVKNKVIVEGKYEEYRQ